MFRNESKNEITVKYCSWQGLLFVTNGHKFHGQVSVSVLILLWDAWFINLQDVTSRKSIFYKKNYKISTDKFMLCVIKSCRFNVFSV